MICRFFRNSKFGSKIVRSPASAGSKIFFYKAVKSLKFNRIALCTKKKVCRQLIEPFREQAPSMLIKLLNMFLDFIVLFICERRTFRRLTAWQQAFYQKASRSRRTAVERGFPQEKMPNVPHVKRVIRPLFTNWIIAFVSPKKQNHFFGSNWLKLMAKASHDERRRFRWQLPKWRDCFY